MDQPQAYVTITWRDVSREMVCILRNEGFTATIYLILPQEAYVKAQITV